MRSRFRLTNRNNDPSVTLRSSDVVTIEGRRRNAFGDAELRDGLAGFVESIDPIDPSLACGSAGTVSHQKVNSCARETNPPR